EASTDNDAVNAASFSLTCVKVSPTCSLPRAYATTAAVSRTRWIDFTPSAAARRGARAAPRSTRAYGGLATLPAARRLGRRRCDSASHLVRRRTPPGPRRWPARTLYDPRGYCTGVRTELAART